MLRFAGRVVLAAAAASAVCVAAMILLARRHGDSVSTEDLSGFGVLSFVFAVVMAVLLYAPGLTYAGTRRWSRAKGTLFAVVVLNMPVYVLLSIGMQRGMLAGLSEGLLFAAAFVVAAIVFASSE